MTILNSSLPGQSVELFPDTGNPEKWVTLTVPRAYTIFSLKRDEFAQAVRDLGFVVIDKAELPEVRVEGESLVTGSTGWPTVLAHKNAEFIREEALSNLALAVHLEANPPIDPKVSTLALYLNTQGIRGVEADRIARGLVDTFPIEIKEN